MADGGELQYGRMASLCCDGTASFAGTGSAWTICKIDYLLADLTIAFQQATLDGNPVQKENLPDVCRVEDGP
jgi:hypothetical protein